MALAWLQAACHSRIASDAMAIDTSGSSSRELQSEGLPRASASLAPVRQSAVLANPHEA